MYNWGRFKNESKLEPYPGNEQKRTFPNCTDCYLCKDYIYKGL